MSLLDLHPSPTFESGNGAGPRLDILEAGTGHGSLTLYLSRAIHGANYPAPTPQVLGSECSTVEPLASAVETKPIVDDDAQSNGLLAVNNNLDESTAFTTSSLPSEQLAAPSSVKQVADNIPASIPELAQWKEKRRAIIHTVDVSQRHSRHAQQIIEGYRNGVYANNVDFHVGSVDEFINQEYEKRNEKQQIFDHIILDLPGVHSYMKIAARALRADGCLLVFAPSVTQIARCVEMIRRHRLPLSYDDVIELGPGYTGGKSWDVRAVQPSRFKPSKTTPDHVAEAYFAEEDGIEKRQPLKPTMLGRIGRFFRRIFGIKQYTAWPQKTAAEREAEEWVMVCRPKVGGRIVGGGFVGVWRRKGYWEPWETVEKEEKEMNGAEKEERLRRE